MKTIKKKKHTHMCGRYRVQEINEVRRKNATKILKEKINEMSEQTRN